MKVKTNKNKRPPSEPIRSERTRSDWQANHARIRDSMLALIDRHKGRIPSQDEIAKASGLSRPTVQRHLKDMDLTEIAKPFRVLADTVLLGLANKAIRGDTNAAKLYFKLTFGDRSSESGTNGEKSDR